MKGRKGGFKIELLILTVRKNLESKVDFVFFSSGRVLILFETVTRLARSLSGISVLSLGGRRSMLAMAQLLPLLISLKIVSEDEMLMGDELSPPASRVMANIVIATDSLFFTFGIRSIGDSLETSVVSPVGSFVYKLRFISTLLPTDLEVRLRGRGVCSSSSDDSTSPSSLRPSGNSLTVIAAAMRFLSSAGSIRRMGTEFALGGSPSRGCVAAATTKLFSATKLSIGTAGRLLQSDYNTNQASIGQETLVTKVMGTQVKARI